MTVAGFAPDQVRLSQLFVGTFDHFEAEVTAVVIVKILAINGNVWRSASFEELAIGFKQLTDNDELWRQWFNNPFVRIDMHDLVGRGFAEWDGDNGIQFTGKGLERIARWAVV